MLDLQELDDLVAVWRQFDGPASNEFGREAGYRAGVKVCADQLAETIERMRKDSDD